MPITPEFKKIFAELNPAQQQAVTTLDGPVMVIAGPGTGKTQVLAARIANILLTTDTNPSSILALTFTESAAKNMRERLIRMIGKTGYYVQIQTFHSFCTDVINSHPEFFPLERDSQPLTELERYDVFQNILDSLPLKVLKPLNSPYFYLKESISSISDLKREGVSPDEFEQILTAEQSLFDQEADELPKGERQQREKNLAKNQELLLIYREYQRLLAEKLRFDFDDMIGFVSTAFVDHEDLLLEYQERLLYFLIDEYQDTNSAQNQVVDQLASYWGEEANIFVVGDPNQAIYRFQGASLENVIGFTHRYSQAQVITLTQGYRSPQTIYDAAADLIKENQTVTEVPSLVPTQALTSQKGPGAPIKLFAAPSQTLETIYIACSIKELMAQGVPLNQIAILYRNNADAIEMYEALERWGIAYEIDGGNNVLEAEHIRQLLCLLKVIEAVRRGTEDETLYEIMQYDWVDLPQLLVMKAARAASRAKCSLYELISRGYQIFVEYDTQGVTPVEFAALENFITQLTTWGARDAQLAFPAWFELVINQSGFLDWVMQQPTKIELLNGVNSLFREIKALSGNKRGFQLPDFLTVIETLEAHNLPITLEDLNIAEAAVRLSTVHKAKGQEWEYVFLMRCVDGKWGNGRNRDLIRLPVGILKNTDASQKERNEDDRRLFYVAISRAKSQLIISYPETIITENRTKQAMGSIFLEEIKAHLVPDTSQCAQNTINKAEVYLAQLLQPPTPKAVDDQERAFFTDLLKGFSLSVSTLNTYLRSPAEFVVTCLLKVPTATTPHMAFGTAIHAAFEQWFKYWQNNGEKMELENLIKAFETNLAKEPLSVEDYQARLGRGREVLENYYPVLMMNEQPPVFIERFFGGNWSRAMLDDISLTGRIDRVDWVDQSLKTVCVIDYKTGKPRTVGEIEATIASAELSDRERKLPVTIRGAYKRQLVFYKLLSELDPTFVPQVVEAVFEFVEPDKQSGKLVSRRFAITDQEVTDLKQLIREVMAEIRSLKFLASL